MATAISWHQCIGVFTKRFDMDLKGLTDVPTDDIPADVTHVNLDLNFITTIEANAFFHLKLCINLHLSYNEIHSIDPSAFNGTNSILGLYLNNNKLTVLGGAMLIGLETLRTLNFSRNQIADIEGVFTCNICVCFTVS